MTALFIVRAEIQDPTARDPFDQWYEREHLPDALAAFQARCAWRGWSETDERVHFAFYEFSTLAEAQAITGSDALKSMVAEFDAKWGERVTRSREIVPVKQTIGG